jgi:hypothetical protein
VKGRPFHVGLGLLLVCEQGFDFVFQFSIVATGTVEKSFPFPIRKRQSFTVKRFDPLHAIRVHAFCSP